MNEEECAVLRRVADALDTTYTEAVIIGIREVDARLKKEGEFASATAAS
jgi:hypothetical protein